MLSFAPITPVGNEDQIYQFGRLKSYDLLPASAKEKSASTELRGPESPRPRWWLDLDPGSEN
jgi:hypothetical protein